MFVKAKSASMDPRVTLNHVKTSWEVQAKEHLIVYLIHKIMCYFICLFLWHAWKLAEKTWETSMEVRKYGKLDKETVEEWMRLSYFGLLISELSVCNVIKVDVTSEKCVANYCSRGCCGQR